MSMSLEYVFDNNPELVKVVKNQGYDIDGLCFMCRDMFVLFEDLGIQPQAISDLLKNLKIVHDTNNNKPIPQDCEESPVKITVTNTLTQKISTFRFFSSQGTDPLYTCDICKRNIAKSEVKSHILEHESS